MRKGVILEVDENFVTLITPDGEYMRTRKLQQEYQIGEEIAFFPLEKDKQENRNVFTFFNTVKGKAIILAAAILFFTTALYPLYESRQVYAYMSIDINPSIELGLNEDLNVISLEGYNEEGNRIIENLDNWKYQRAVVVAERIIEEIEMQGYLEADDDVLIAAVPSKRTKASEEDILGEAITEIRKVTEAEKLEVTVVNGTFEERETAIAQGVTTGVYKIGTQMKAEKEEESEKQTEKQPQPSESKKINPITNKSETANNQNNGSQKEPAKEVKKSNGLGNNNPGQSKKQAANEQTTLNKEKQKDAVEENSGNNEKKANQGTNKQNENRGNEKSSWNNGNNKQNENRGNGKSSWNNGNNKQNDNSRNEKQNNGNANGKNKE